MMRIRILVNIILGIIIWVPVMCLAAIQAPYTIVIKDHRFDPVPLNIPAKEKVKLTIYNQDATPEDRASPASETR